MNSLTTTASRESEFSTCASQGDQTEFRLPLEQWDAFCRRLDAPPQTIPALVQLFREADPFHPDFNPGLLKCDCPPART